MRTTTTRIAGASIAAAAAMALTVGPAFAADSWVSANLKPVAGSDVQGSGTAQVTVSGTTIKVEMAASGLLPDQPHAAHIHFAAAARHECPTINDDTSGDAPLNTTEGGPAYGDIVVSLTKTGDTSPKSGLAVDRFSTAPGGKISYERGSITRLRRRGRGHLQGPVRRRHPRRRPRPRRQVLRRDQERPRPHPAHGGDRPGPLWCPPHAAPAGGMDTGGGLGSTTNDNGMLLAVGGIALVAAAGSGAAAARRARARG